MLFLVRHGDAGERAQWLGEDAERPLSALGRLQSVALIGMLSEYAIGRIVSSPAARCVQTVEPLARGRRLPIVTSPELSVDGEPAAVIGLARRLAGDGALLCSHGEVIGAFLHRLLGDGHASPLDQPGWQKGSVWVLDGLDRGSRAARYLPPSPQ